jgi:hypothetical protein
MNLMDLVTDRPLLAWLKGSKVMPMQGKDLLDLRNRILEKFTSSDWANVGLLTDAEKIINGHARLLRSLYFGDEDYSGNIVEVLRAIERANPTGLNAIEQYLAETYPDAVASTYISARPAGRKITFSPSVFEVPSGNVDPNLVSVMMPFGIQFNSVYQTIQLACSQAHFSCLRADNIWAESAFTQDIFNLIFRSVIVVVDFSGKNPNVMYETGIAHTLGKTVVPITQNLDDVPSDIKHHRVLVYLNNQEGLSSLLNGLATRLSYLRQVA